MPCVVTPLPRNHSVDPVTGDVTPNNASYVGSLIRWAALSNGVSRTGSHSGLSTDGPQQVYAPFTSQEWAAIGLPAPLVQWGCQDSSGNLVSSTGTEDLEPAGSSLLYGQSITGWSRKFVGTTGLSGQHWHSTSSLFSANLNQAWAWLIYASTANAVGTSLALVTQGTTGWALQIGTTGRIRTVFDGSGQTDTSGPAHSDINTVRPYIFFRKSNTATNMGVLTDIRSLPTQGSSASDAITNTSSGFGPISGTSLSARLGLAAFWKGSDADIISDRSTLVTLRWAVSW